MMSHGQAIEETTRYLASPEARSSIDRDPYWPKWDSPWWHMLTLHEMGLDGVIPRPATEHMAARIKAHFLPFFPLRIEEVPEGADPYRNIMCFCALGSIYQVLAGCGVDVDREIPWMREWFCRYQLPDGGYNCDESVYTRAEPKSSIVSTLPCLEALLFCAGGSLTPEEHAVLEKGAQYLVRHRLFRRISDGSIINRDWMEIRFPRFYEYDYLRGYYFLAKWSEFSGFVIPDELTDEVAGLVGKQTRDGNIVLKRYNLFDRYSRTPGPDGTWQRGTASEFRLMQAVSAEGLACPPLTRKWDEVRPVP